MHGAEQFIKDNGQWLDEVAEANDNLGTLQGVAFATISQQPSKSRINAVQLVFDHGIIEARLDNHELLAVRMITRIDEVGDNKHTTEIVEGGDSLYYVIRLNGVEIGRAYAGNYDDDFGDQDWNEHPISEEQARDRMGDEYYEWACERQKSVRYDLPLPKEDE